MLGFRALLPVAGVVSWLATQQVQVVAGADRSNTAPVPISELSVDAVQTLLQDWNLDAAFSSDFLAFQVDGHALELMDLDSVVPSAFPKAQGFQWKKLFTKRDAYVTATRYEVVETPVSSQGLSSKVPQRRNLATTSDNTYTGLSITKNHSMVSFGTASDVKIKRTGDRALEIDADHLTVTGTLAFDANTTLSDLINDADPKEAGTWERVYTFGVNDICSEESLNATGLVFSVSNATSFALDEDCNYDNFGIWCPGGCDGHIDIPIGDKSNIATHARIKVGVTYDHESCQGFVSLKNEITGNSEVVWTHDKGTTTDIATVEVKLEEGDVFVVSETGTCIVDMYFVDVYTRDLGARVRSIEDATRSPAGAGTWETMYDFGVNSICSYSSMVAAGLSLVSEDGYTDLGSSLVDQYCQTDYFGVWCPSGCTGTVVVPLDFNTTFARATVAVSYDNDSCQGRVSQVTADGTESVLWTHTVGEPTDVQTITFSYEEGDVLHIQETGTCIVDLYSIEAYKIDVADRLTRLEAHVDYLEQLLFNHSLVLDEVSAECEWDTIHVFGDDVDGGLCSIADMTAAGWDSVDISDQRCSDGSFGGWCPGSCTGHFQYVLPSGYKAASMTIGSTYGGSCQGHIHLVHPDGSTTNFFTSTAGSSFGPTEVIMQYDYGDTLQITEVATCIIELYEFALLPVAC